MKLDIHIDSKEDYDLQLALEEVLRKVVEGYTSGADRNETGRYYFDIKDN